MASRILLLIAMGATTVWSFTAPNAKFFKDPELARMIFFHLPCAFSSVLWLVITCILSGKVLKHRTVELDGRAAAAAELTMTFMVLTLITGIFFSRVQWGHWWHGDPRQTSFLIASLMFAAYFLLRMAYVDDIKKAANSAVYAISMLLPILFLVFVYTRLPGVQARTVHPQNTLQEGLLKGEYLYITLLIFTLMVVISTWQYRLRVRATQLERTLEDLDGQLDDGGASAARGVVRPVRLSDQDGSSS